MDLSNDLKDVFTKTAQILKNSDRRIFMARVVKALGKGGQRYAEDELNWNRDVIRKGIHEQTDPTFMPTRLYTRLSSAEVRKQLIEQKGYTDSNLPSEETIRQKLQELGYRMRAVQKSQPKKKFLRPMQFLTN